jgi:hypothetical protein
MIPETCIWIVDSRAARARSENLLTHLYFPWTSNQFGVHQKGAGGHAFTDKGGVHQKGAVGGVIWYPPLSDAAGPNGHRRAWARGVGARRDQTSAAAPGQHLRSPAVTTSPTTARYSQEPARRVLLYNYNYYS